MALPSYTRDTSDLLGKIEGMQIEDSWYLASIDVEALYSSIIHEIGLKAVSFYLDTRSNHLLTHNKFILDLLQFILTHNYFLFDSAYYHQLRGTAMGSPCAPSYANLTLGWWEDTIVFTDSTTHFTQYIVFWTRYIDDVFIIWSGSQSLFKDFITTLNHNSIGLFFTSDIQLTQLPFLDVLISKNGQGQLDTTLYRKPTAGNNLLRWQSFHPFPLRKGIPKGQFLRVRRNCSSEDTFREEASKLYSRFQERGYPNKHLDTALRSVQSTSRQDLLNPRTTSKNEDGGFTRIIATFDTASQEIRNIIQKHWDILTMDRDLKDAVSPYPLISFRRGRNVRDRLVSSHFASQKPLTNWLSQRKPGTFRCGKCRACQFIKVDNQYFDKELHRSFRSRTFANCKTTGVVYIATCICGLRYVGKTTREFKCRILEHIGDVNNNRDKPIAKHVNNKHNGNPTVLQFQALEIISPSQRRGNLDKILTQKETRWIFLLDTVQPHGLNENLNFTSFI
ncbi:uncharacterized protein LOC130356667 [Hyla sarda]|uniref:uncharacterized protein LOC130356667 n=1 Tax=Hyla sarda TaxID=327740 RepID=UPI0024C2D7D2|nr:uncharacterized protein LOC130356667 [Hyla sarda]XP_056414466.1 uncharacterized protein LOC130356667 [Hyla sarda]